MTGEANDIPWPARHRSLFLAVALLLTLIAYGNSLRGDFVWDDISLIKDNPVLRDPASLSQIFSSYFKLSPEEPTSFYRPLAMVTYLADYQVWKLNPMGYHVTNLLFHLLATFLFFVAGRKLFSETAALIAALLFALHPVHTESVSFISGRTDVLCAIFYLAAMISHLNRRALLSVSFFAAALLAKEMAITLPLVLIAIDIWGSERKSTWRRLAMRYLPYFLVIAGYLLLRTEILGVTAVPLPSPGDFLTRVMMAPVLIAKYLFLCIFPWKLNALYVMSAARGWADPMLLMGVGVTLGIIVLVLVGRRAGWGFCLFWFLATLLPVLNLLQTGSAPMAERFLYIPSMGFAWLAGLVAERFMEYEKAAVRNGALAVLVLLTVFYSARTVVRNMDWRDELTLYTRLVEDSPKSAAAHFNLGCIYRDRNDYKTAIIHWQEAIRLDPGHASSHNNLGAAYDVMGLEDLAMTEYRKALELNPKNAVTWFNLGRIYRMKGRHAEANRCFEEYRRLTR